ncbi:MerR family transcriptional regulator [Amphritea balenae]|uniref:MerR family DNA-binding transcriptional regulator n=1 Tax=Amphritea balenae TaxID=452629 RepID=A0A3P1SM38_9GAMM|nr:MerR family DNA-binding transcriptional regulator [Amphritea balenae]RRC98009.1 MerR family DNA-binding transcriptional regulator [Amphritea balenae]GGK66746.1 hypothetical protein GCM10007941_16070 [Amphritea balenae]
MLRQYAPDNNPIVTSEDQHTVTDLKHETESEADNSATETNEISYSITQLSQEFNISSRAIRFYEDKGLLNPDRSKYRRAYSKRDRVRLMLILRGKRVGFSLDESRELFDIYDSGTDEATQLQHWFKLLQKHEDRLEQNKRDIEELLVEVKNAKSHCQEFIKTAATE